MPALLTRGAESAANHLLLAHGAGTGMTSPFLETLTERLVSRGLCVSRFEFDYMAAVRKGGKRRPPPKAEGLTAEFEAAVEAVRALSPEGQLLVIGGKSMGGRVASLVADRLYAAGAVAGLAVVGYPFHPPGKPDALRTAHLERLKAPALIVQGERDPFGTRTEVEGYRLSPAIRLHWIAGGDHDFRLARGTPKSGDGPIAEAAEAIARFATSIAHNSTARRR